MSRTARPVPWSCMNRSLPDARPSMLRPGSEVSSLGARAERTPYPSYCGRHKGSTTVMIV